MPGHSKTVIQLPCHESSDKSSGIQPSEVRTDRPKSAPACHVSPGRFCRHSAADIVCPSSGERKRPPEKYSAAPLCGLSRAAMPSARQSITNSRCERRSAQRRRIAPTGKVTICRYSASGACRMFPRIHCQICSGCWQNLCFCASEKYSNNVSRQQASGSVPIRGHKT